VVLRVLDRSSVSLEIENLGFPKYLYDYVVEAIQRPNGIVIVTGPTGCGKTTTLYSALRRVNSIEGSWDIALRFPLCVVEHAYNTRHFGQTERCCVSRQEGD
jgi:Tfp pilus assembly pilus retraction ATPase PilT